MLSIFVFKKSSEKKISTIIFVVKSLKGSGLNNVGPASQTVAQHNFTTGPMYCVIRVVAFRGTKRFLGKRRLRLTGIEPAMVYDSGPTLNRYWVGRSTLCEPGTSHRVISDGSGRNRHTR